MNDIKDRPFRFGAIVHQDFESLGLLMADLEDRFNQSISLSDFTDKIQIIYFMPIILPDADDQEEESRYDAEQKKIFLRVKIDPHSLEGLEEVGFLILVKSTFLENLRKMEILPESLLEKLEQD